MQDICFTWSRIALVIIIVAGAIAGLSASTDSAPGSVWKVRYIFICYGGGNCTVLDANGNPLPQPETIFDGLGGATNATAINNKLQFLVTENKSGGSKVVEWSIAGLDPSGNAVSHGTTTFDGTGGGSSNIQALAVNSDGHMFVGNASPSSITEISQGSGLTPPPNQTFATVTGATFTPSGDCAATGFGSLDLNKQIGNTQSLYFTANDGEVRQVTLPLSTASCFLFANLGTGVTFSGLRDIPPSALIGQTCAGVNCPSTETVLVVAKGFFDATGNGLSSDAGDFNVCTDATKSASPLVSCGLLIDPNGPGLTATPWHGPQQKYFSATTILDEHLHVQQMTTPGRSGAAQPAWIDATYPGSGGTTPDGAVIWADKGSMVWQPNTTTQTYTAGTVIVDSSAHHVQQVTGQGSPGPGPSGPTFNDSGAPTTDGLQWTFVGKNKCPQTVCLDWQPDKAYCAGCVAGIAFQDSKSNVWQITPPSLGATAGGISGHLANKPVFYNGGKPISSPINDNAVVWLDEGGVWTMDTPYTAAATTLNCGSGHSCVGDANQHLWLATTTGYSSPSINPQFASHEGPNLLTDGLQWTDLGTSVVARYPIFSPTGQTVASAKPLALDPLLAQPVCTQVTNPSDNGVPTITCGAATPTVTKFWVGDASSGNFWRINFSDMLSSANPPTQLNSGVASIQSIALYGGEGAAQSGLTQIGSGLNIQLSPASPSVLLNFDPTTSTPTDCGDPLSQPPFPQSNISSCNPLELTGYNLSALPLPSTVTLTAYASAVNSGNASEISDFLSTPVPVGFASVFASPASCTTTTSDNRCVIWDVDENPIPTGSTFLATNLILPGITLSTPNFDPHTAFVALDEQYDTTDAAGVDDTGTIGTKKASQVSLHTIPPTNGGTNTASVCTYVSPLNPTDTTPPACFTTTRTTIPIKFQCTNLAVAVSSLRPFLHLLLSNSSNVKQPVPTLGTGGTTNYRLDPVSGTWVFNLNNPGLGSYRIGTEDATHNVGEFYSLFNVQTSCP